MGPHRIHLGLVVVVVTAAGGVGACTSILGADERYEGAGGSSGTSSGETASASSSSSSGGGAATASGSSASGSTSGGGGEGPLHVPCDDLSSSAEWSRLAPGTSRPRATHAFTKFRFAHLTDGQASMAAPLELPPDPVGEGVKDAVIVPELGMLTLGMDGAVTYWSVQADTGDISFGPGVSLDVLTKDGVPPLFTAIAEEQLLVSVNTAKEGAVLVSCAADLGDCILVPRDSTCASGDDARTFGFVEGAAVATYFWLCDDVVHVYDGSREVVTLPAAGVRELALVARPDLHLVTGGAASSDTVELRAPGGAIVVFGDSSDASAPTMVRTETRLVAAWEAGDGLRLATCETDGVTLSPETCRCETLSTRGGDVADGIVTGRSPFLAADEETIVLGFTDDRGAVDHAATLLVPTASTER